MVSLNNVILCVNIIVICQHAFEKQILNHVVTGPEDVL